MGRSFSETLDLETADSVEAFAEEVEPAEEEEGAPVQFPSDQGLSALETNPKL